METALPKDDLELHKAFEIIKTIESFSNYILEIAELIYDNKLNRESIQNILDKHKITKIEDIKTELIDLLIVYINLVLNDHIISENEKYNVGILKKYFKIKEGNFYTYRRQEVEYILYRQFERIYSDNIIDDDEAIYSIYLQELFNLSYDQFDKFKENEIRRAIDQDADITKLDTARIPKSTDTSSNKDFIQQIKDKVLNRDKEKCIKCGSDEQLEFDCIIPLAKGGTFTPLNIRLLCKSCKKTN